VEYGFKKDEVIGKNVLKFVSKRYWPRILKDITKVARGKLAEGETELKTPKGIRIVEYRANPIKEGKKVVAFQTILRDITENKKAEEALRESEEKYRSVVETASEGIVLLDKKGKIIEANKKILELAGLNREEVVGKNFVRLLPKLKMNIKDTISGFKNVIRGKAAEERVWTFTNTEGKQISCIGHRALIKRDGKIIGLSMILEDVTERKKAEDRIKRSLKEKELLLREIHHRVKNNLQIVFSLMNLQTGYVDDEESVNVLQESQSRVKSMAIIHELLYQTESLSEIDLGRYVPSLVSYLFDSYAVDPRRIKLNMEMEDVLFNIDTAVPCGLIINELVSNSLKHAFPEGKEGEITIKLQSTDSKYMLIISDNGIGFPKDLDFKNTESLGLQLVNSLTGQIDGKIELDRSHGTEFKIIFKELKYEERM